MEYVPIHQMQSRSRIHYLDKVIVIDQGKIVGSGSVDGFLKATKTGSGSTKADPAPSGTTMTDPITS